MSNEGLGSEGDIDIEAGDRSPWRANA